MWRYAVAAHWGVQSHGAWLSAGRYRWDEADWRPRRAGTFATRGRGRCGLECDDGAVPWAPYPSSDDRPGLSRVAEALDPVLTPLGFAPGQAGASDGRGQVIFCRGVVDSTDDGCVDLVVDVEAMPDWRIVDVRYWGLPSDKWHVDFDRQADLPGQLAHLAQTLPMQLA